MKFNFEVSKPETDGSWDAALRFTRNNIDETSARDLTLLELKDKDLANLT